MRIARIIVLASVIGLSATALAEPDPLKMVRGKFEAFNRHDADFIESSYAVNATLHSPDYPDLTGNKPIGDTYRGLFAAIPDAVDEIQSLEAGRDHVYIQFILTGHLKGDSDKPVHVRIISVYKVHGDHIIEDATYYDRKY